jgi:DNA-binding transcriptional regulator YhcF (GntR family)
MAHPESLPESGTRDLRAHDLERLIEQQIRVGAYAVGTRLPTVRELAEQYRVNKNTASRAYQALERRGLIDLARGRGAFVRPLPTVELPWQERLVQLVREAHQNAVSRNQILATLTGAVDQIYGSSTPRLVFVECNRQDLDALGADLRTLTGTGFDLALLDDVVAAPNVYTDRYDLLVTTFQHLGQIRQAVPAATRPKVVGILATPSHDSLLDLSRLHVATFGLVCDAPSTIESLTHIISTYNPAATILPTLIDDVAQLYRVVAQADAIVVTRSSRERLLALGLAQPIVTVVFTIDQQSIDFLRGRIQEVRRMTG